MKNRIPVIAVQGPTASGKSSLAIRLCEKLDGELVSCDSMQIYKNMDIGTAKPSKDDLRRVPHHMIDIKDPTEDFSVGAFAEFAEHIIKDIHERKKMPVLCGGTGLYLDSVLRGISFGELTPDPDYREELAAFAEENGVAALHAKLAEIDKEAADSIHPNNVKRVIRALEICKQSGMTKTEWDKKAITESPYAPVFLALDFHDRDLLYTRIDRRVDEMMEQGLLQEIQSLLENKKLIPHTTAYDAIGYKEFMGYFAGEISLETAVTNVKLATRHYAKRQLTWLRRNPDIHFLYPDEKTPDEIFAEACEIINACRK